MARDFIYELKELKRFSDDEVDREYLDLDEMRQDGMYDRLKKKVNKCTQTVQQFNKQSQKQTAGAVEELKEKKEEVSPRKRG